MKVYQLLENDWESSRHGQESLEKKLKGLEYEAQIEFERMDPSLVWTSDNQYVAVGPDRLVTFQTGFSEESFQVHSIKLYGYTASRVYVSNDVNIFIEPGYPGLDKKVQYHCKKMTELNYEIAKTQKALAEINPDWEL